MIEADSVSFIAECFWADVHESDLRALDERVEQSVLALRRADKPLRYLGSLLVREDEVVLCLFDGPAEAVREVAERARVPFERIVETSRSPWSMPETS